MSDKCPSPRRQKVKMEPETVGEAKKMKIDDFQERKKEIKNSTTNKDVMKKKKVT